MAALRPVHYQQLVRIFEQDGFHYVRHERDHMMFVKTGIRRPLVIPTYRSVPVFIIKNLLRTSGMTREKYFELLQSP
jgi:predicted RNA binding protein YcfA (HicA-like mRNA interferase family)